MSLSQRKILIGITGGIAAYKVPELVRRLRDHGAEVQIVMTEAAQSFITTLTLQAVSGHPVHTSLLDPAAEAAMGHIELARWADLILVAPASADFMARLAHGHANDLLATLCVAARCPIAVAPAMNQAMWSAPATVANCQTLLQRGVYVWGPASGAQACGDVGAGRMLEPEQLLLAVRQHFQGVLPDQRLRAETFTDYTASLNASPLQLPSPLPQILRDQRVVITAGPTREAIDPVRFISNYSSGKMGFALADAAARSGAIVTLITGPVSLATPNQVTRIDVVSAQEMFDSARTACQDADLFIATAAVADYRPETTAGQKMKKQKGAPITLTLIENPDIVGTIAGDTQNAKRPFIVGFAAETQNVLQYARDKLVRKHLDMIVANDVSQTEIGFNSDDNAVTLVWAEGEKVLPRASKPTIALQIIEEVALRLAQKG
ncbi:Phosphopantothenoylcysteine synthetase/decarboxylase [gamma proteobacterium HdN1]|nr:Phosphopantothenoylcysteine synthetase/decarboxylase [gamma proteobacterium HdN1]